MSDYFRSLVRYYMHASFDDLDAQSVRQAKRCLLDASGCALAAVRAVPKELAFVQMLDNADRSCGVFGTGLRLCAPLAAFANSLLTSVMEMDDATAIGASVHPACCVIPPAVAAAEKYHRNGQELLKTIVFGYDLCNRLGLMATQRIQELGLYGPGVISGACAAAVSGMLMGLDEDSLVHSFSMALSLSPICPFSSFTDGADSKNFYSAWGVYLGMLSSLMAQQGFTGPEHILKGQRSMQFLFSSDIGIDISPGDGQFAQAVQFKNYAACLSVHTTMTAIEHLCSQNTFHADEIISVDIGTYPYACNLNALTEKITSVSARTSIPYTAAVMLLEKRLDPVFFTKEALEDRRYRELMSRIHVSCVEEYGTGPFGIRGSRVTVMLADGRILRAESTAAKWNAADPPSDDELLAKFNRLTDMLSVTRRVQLAQAIFQIDASGGIFRYLELINTNGDAELGVNNKRPLH